MATGTRTSGLIQTVKSFVLHDRIEMDGSAQRQGLDLDEATKDKNSPNAIPDVPTTEAAYDGLVAFGVIEVDIP